MMGAPTSARDRLDQAAVKAVNLVEGFANVEDPHSSSVDNPWKHPESIYQQLADARGDLMQAWEDVKQEVDDRHNTPLKAAAAPTTPPEEFRALYMDMITDAFADVLENMRAKEGDSLDVDILVDCLQSGMDMLTTEERDGFMEAFDHEFDNEDESEMTDAVKQMTPHELHRHQRGLDVPAISE